jgi:transcription elongation factor GreA
MNEATSHTPSTQETEVRLAQEAYDQLKQELDELVANRPVIAAKINVAREEGDLRENGGYLAAREEQAQLEARIRRLQELLRVAKVGEARAEPGVAGPGMVVTVRHEDDKETETFLLGSLEEVAHGDLEVYSLNSPLGKAIIGAHEGEGRRYELPNGGSATVVVVEAKPYYYKPLKHEGFVRRSKTSGCQSLRTAPLSIYTSSDHAPTKLIGAVHDLLVDCDIEIEYENPLQYGSWFKSWSIREKRPAALDKLVELAEKAERAGELKYIYGQRAQSDELEANAVATVISALNGLDSAVIQLSSVIIVKSDGRIVARVLSEEELSILREHSKLLKSPREILTALPQLVSNRAFDPACSPEVEVDELVQCGQDGEPQGLESTSTDNVSGPIERTDVRDDTCYGPKEVTANCGDEDLLRKNRSVRP